MLADDLEPLPPPPLPGYAPRLCTHGPSHYARRDPDAPGITWACADCGLTWTTPKTARPPHPRPEGAGPPPQEDQ